MVALQRTKPVIVGGVVGVGQRHAVGIADDERAIRLGDSPRAGEAAFFRHDGCGLSWGELDKILAAILPMDRCGMDAKSLNDFNGRKIGFGSRFPNDFNGSGFPASPTTYFLSI